MVQIRHYERLNKLGEGGMGTVYRGLDTHTQQTIAIKQLKADIARPDIIERFKREGEALRELNHPNIVKMLDMFEHDGKHYLIMEYVSGGDLKALIEKGRIEYQTCVNMAIDLADALTRAHRLNIIHRDLKPANVLIDENGVLRLTDFGVAHIGSKVRVTQPDAIVGTINYLPPEVFDNGIFDTRGDIWAFGVMLFEMLTGERLYKGETVYETLQAILTQPLPDLEALCPDVAIGLVDLIYRMLEHDLQVRIPSVRIIGAELEAILEGRDQTPQPHRFDTESSSLSILPKNNLPAQVTPFVGREHELAELRKLLKDTSLRLITVIASGGMGKTRLALEVGQQSLSLFHHKVYFVELTALDDSTGIIPAIADALGYIFQNDERSPEQQVIDYLTNKTCLLIMDNYEHLMDGVGLITEILKSCPRVQILVTSRRPISQPGETLFHLAGMDFPDWETTDDAMNYASVKLFVNSAKRVRPNFDLNQHNLTDVAHICRIVQGLPLGIVLAASWLGMLSTSEVVHEMQQSINFLATDETNLPQRQRSIRAVMNYTWQIMTEIERHIFMQATVFRGGFSRDAIQAITGASLRNLMALTNKSVLHRDVDSGRYTIHELLRQYAAEKLQKSGDKATALDHHMRYYVTQLSQHEQEFRGRGQVISALQVLEDDIENIQVAWQTATDAGHFEVVDELMTGLFHFYDMRGWMVKGEHQFGQTAEIVRQSADEKYYILLGKLQARQAKFLFYIGSHEAALDALNESLTLLNNPDTEDELGFALSIYADALSFMGDFEGARDMCTRSLAIFRKTNDRWGIATALNNLGVAHYYLEDYDRAIAHYEESMEISREIGDLSGVAAILSNLGAIAHDQQQYDRATTLYRESMRLSEKLNDQYGIASTQLNLGWTLFIVGDYQRAYDYSKQSIKIATRLGNRWLITTGNINLGTIACEMDDLIASKSYLATAYQQVRQLGATHLLPDIIVATASLLIKHQQYKKAYQLLIYSKAQAGVEHETASRIDTLIKVVELQISYKVVENISKSVDNKTIEHILNSIFF